MGHELTQTGPFQPRGTALLARAGGINARRTRGPSSTERVLSNQQHQENHAAQFQVSGEGFPQGVKVRSERGSSQLRPFQTHNTPLSIAPLLEQHKNWVKHQKQKHQNPN